MHWHQLGIMDGDRWPLIAVAYCGQTMTKAEHNWPISKLFDNRPLASVAEVFCETIGLVIYIQNIPIIVYFSFLKVN